MKKVLIFYGSYGGGHLSAARSIKEYIDNHYVDTQTEMVDCVEYANKYINKLTVKTYDKLSQKAPWAWKRVYFSSDAGFLSKFSNLSNKILAIKLAKLINKISPDYIISAHPFSSQMCARLKKKNSISAPVSTVMTDFHIHNQWLVKYEYINSFFVANNQMKNDLIKHGIKEEKIFVTGIPLSEKFLKEYNKEDIFNEYSLDSSKFNILFFGSGENHFGKEKTKEVFNILLKNFPDYQLIAVAGRNKEIKSLFDELLEQSGNNKNVRVFGFTKQVPEFMSIADVVITKPGGLTSTESLVSGLPIIVLNPIPGQEEQNAKFLEDSGVAVWSKKNEDLEKVITSSLNNLEKLKEMKEKTKLFSNKNSTRDICETILGKINK